MITGTSGVAGTIPMKFGVNVHRRQRAALPNWYAAKAALDPAAAGTDQKAYTDALSDVHLRRSAARRTGSTSSATSAPFRKQLMLLNGVIQ